MPQRYYRNYYRAPEVSPDPLASAIGSAFDAFQAQREASEERAEQRRQKERQEQIDRERQEDRAADKADRESRRTVEAADRRFKYAQEGYMERPMPSIPGSATGTGMAFDLSSLGNTMQKVMPSQRERAATLEEAIRQRHEADAKRQADARERAGLEAEAAQLGLTAQGVPLEQLRVVVASAKEQEKGKRELEVYEKKKKIDARYREPKDADDNTPSFLKPADIAKRAAGKTQPTRDHLTNQVLAPGMEPDAAGRSALDDTQKMAQAAFRAEFDRLQAAYMKAQINAAGDPQKMAQIKSEYEATVVALKRRYQMPE